MTPVDVLVVHYRTPELTRQAVELVRGPGCRVLVHDNSGDLPAAVAEVAEVLGDGTNVLYAAASNALFQAGTSAYVLLLNPDVLLPYAELVLLVEELDAHPEAWGVAPQLVGLDGSSQSYARRLPTLRALLADRCPPLRPVLRRHWRAYRCQDTDLSRAETVSQPAAACLLLRRARVPGRLMDPAYPLFFNDTDLARRLAPTGPCRYLGGLRVKHVGGASVDLARRTHTAWVRRQYDDALLHYARANLRGWQLLVPLVLLRRLRALRPAGPEVAR